MTRSRLAVLVVLTLSVVSSAEAQGTMTVTPSSPPHALAEYSGVTPGEGDRPPSEGSISPGRTTGRRAPRTVATWPGFQPASGGGGSRFFVQTNAVIATSTSTSPGRVEILFPNARTHLSNTRRWLETEFFDTPVLRAHFERRGRDLVLVFFLRNALGGTSPVSVTPSITSGTDSSGYFFTYIDFPPGRWIAEPVAPPPEPASETTRASEPGRAPSRTDDFSGMDDERPPPATRGPSP